MEKPNYSSSSFDSENKGAKLGEMENMGKRVRTITDEQRARHIDRKMGDYKNEEWRN
jgi:hypothetical protein